MNEWIDVFELATLLVSGATLVVEPLDGRTASAGHCFQQRESLGYGRDHTVVLVDKNVDVSVIVACSIGVCGRVDG